MKDLSKETGEAGKSCTENFAKPLFGLAKTSYTGGRSGEMQAEMVDKI
jgi:hypothetical protein